MPDKPHRQRKRDDRKNVQSYLPADHVDALDRLAESTGMSRAFWIAEAVRRLLIQAGQLQPPETDLPLLPPPSPTPSPTPKPPANPDPTKPAKRKKK